MEISQLQKKIKFFNKSQLARNLKAFFNLSPLLRHLLLSQQIPDYLPASFPHPIVSIKSQYAAQDL